MYSKREASYETAGVVSAQRGLSPKKILASLLVLAMMLAVMLNVAALTVDDRHSANLSSLDYDASSSLASGLQGIGLLTASAESAEEDDADAQKYYDGDDDSFVKKKQTDLGGDFKNTQMESGDSFAAESPDKSTAGNDWMTTADQASQTTNASGDNRSAQVGSGDDQNFGDVFSMVIRRLWPGYYISSNLDNTPDHADAWDINSVNYLNCTDLDDIENGDKKTQQNPTLKNRNCDVPGLGTEAVQDLLSLFDGHGVSNADRQTAKTPFGLGVATELLPTDDVPVKNSARTDKYSGLELFGYNLHWSEYNGEWDHIKVNTTVRLKSSMTFSQGLKTIGQAVGDGISAFAGSVSHDVGDKFKSGDWLDGIIAAVNPFTYWKAMSEGISSAMYKIVANVMNSFETTAITSGNWYRPTFSSETQYGVRSLTQVEKNAIIIAKVKKITEGSVKSLDNTDDLLNYDEATLRTQLSPPPAPTRTECKNCTGSSQLNGVSQDWDEWKEEHKDKLENVGKKQLGLDVSQYDNVQGDSEKKYDAFVSAWNNAVEDKVVQGKDDKVNSSYQTIMDKIKADIEKQISDDLSKRPASAWLYCTDASGNPQGTPEDEAVKEAVANGLMENPGKEAYGPNGDKGWQCDQPERPTIVGGLLGSSRKDVSGKYVDTRRTAYAGVNVLDMLVGNKVDGWGQTALSWSQNVTIVLNTIVGWCFQPILDQLGVKDIIVDWIGKLRDTIYFQLVVLMMAFAGLLVMRKLVFGHPIESFKQLAIIILTFGLGVMLLFAPKNMVALVDDVPTALERAAIGTIFQSSSNDVLCSVTGTPKGTVSATKVFNDIFGNNTNFNPDAQVRTLQCRIWETFVVTPWSYGQWGTNINQLWADGYASSQQISTSSGELDVSDSVAKLVGNASVPMGGGTTINNWGIYQIYQQTSGTSTTEDNDRPTKTIDKNIYRLVDLQAGPNNGAGRDSEHFAAWSGKTGNKFVVGVSALALSVLGLLAIGGLALKKLEYTLMATVLLLCSPFMLLLGLLPGKNQLRLKQYGFEILGLCIKRVVTVVFMCVTLEIMLEVVSGSDADWGSTFAGMFAILLMIKMYGGELLAMMTKKVDDQSGEWNKADDAVSDYIQSDPTLLGITDAAKNMFLATAGTAIGSALAGQFHNPNTPARIQQRMIDSYMGKDGSAVNAMRIENARYADTVNAIRKKYAGKTDVMSLQRMQTELARSKSSHDAYIANYNKNRELAMDLAKARGQDFIDSNGVRHKGTVMDSVSSIMSAAISYNKARSTGQLNQFKKDALTPAQVASERLAVLMNRTRAVRIRQGKTSALLEARRNSNLNWERSEMRAQQELMARIQVNRAEAPTINAKGAISLRAADSVMNSGRTVMSYGMSQNLGMTDAQLQTMVMSAANKQQLLADWQIAEQTGDWNQVRADLAESGAMQKGTTAYRELWQPKVDQVEDAKNEAILNQGDKVKKAKDAVEEAEILHQSAIDMGDDKQVKKTNKALKAARKSYAAAQHELSKMTEDKHGRFTAALTKQVIDSNANDAKGMLALEQKKDEVAATKEKAIEKLLGKDYVDVKRSEQSADGRRKFEDSMRSATLKWQSTLEIADKLEKDGQTEAAAAMRKDADKALTSARKEFMRSKSMAAEWESSFENQLTDLHDKHEAGKLSGDEYHEKVEDLFKTAEAIKTSDEMMAAIEGAQSLRAEAEAKTTAQSKLDEVKSQLKSGEYSQDLLERAASSGLTPEDALKNDVKHYEAVISSIETREKLVVDAISSHSVDTGNALIDEAAAGELPTAREATKIREKTADVSTFEKQAKKYDEKASKYLKKEKEAHDNLSAVKAAVADREATRAQRPEIMDVYNPTEFEAFHDAASVAMAEHKLDKATSKTKALEEDFRSQSTLNPLLGSADRAVKQAVTWLDIVDRSGIDVANKTLKFDNISRQSDEIRELSDPLLKRDFEDAQLSFGGGLMDDERYDPFKKAEAAAFNPSVLDYDKLDINDKVSGAIKTDYAAIPYEGKEPATPEEAKQNERDKFAKWAPISYQSGVLMETNLTKIPDVFMPEKRTPMRVTNPTVSSTSSESTTNREISPWSTEKKTEIEDKLSFSRNPAGTIANDALAVNAMTLGLGISSPKATDMLSDPIDAMRKQGVPDQEIEDMADKFSSTDIFSMKPAEVEKEVRTFHDDWSAAHSTDSGQVKPAADTAAFQSLWSQPVQPTTGHKSPMARPDVNEKSAPGDTKFNAVEDKRDSARPSMIERSKPADTDGSDVSDGSWFASESQKASGISDEDIRFLADFSDRYAGDGRASLTPSGMGEALSRQKAEWQRQKEESSELSTGSQDSTDSKPETKTARSLHRPVTESKNTELDPASRRAGQEKTSGATERKMHRPSPKSDSDASSGRRKYGRPRRKK